MPFEFESLVGHLYVVSGRAISSSPPGALVEVAPKKAARGRQTDTFFALVRPSGNMIASTAFYEQMALLAAERYFNSAGSITSGLREVFDTLNKNLTDHNQRAERPYEVNILCAVLRGSDLIVGRVGACVMLMRQHGQMLSSPENLGDRRALYTKPLGVEEVPDVKMTQWKVNNGTRIVFGDSNLASLDRDQMRNALLSLDIATVLVSFKELARLNLSMLVIEFVPPDMPTPETIPAGRSTATIAKSPTQSSESPEELPSQPSKTKLKAQKNAGRAFLSIASLLGLVSRVIGHFFGDSDEGDKDEKKRRLFSPAVSTGMVFLLPVVVVGLVMLLWLSKVDSDTPILLCIEDANELADLAQSPGVVNSSRNNVINAWELVAAQVEECYTLGSDSPELADLQREAQQVIDNLSQITRREAIQIESLPQANLTRIIMQGQDLYVLDKANELVYQVTLADGGLARSSPGRAIPEMRRGGSASGIVVDEIFDIGYNDRDNVIVAIDVNGVLIECSPKFLQCTGQRLFGVENWIQPVAFTIWNGRIYILDVGVGNGQIWRYDSAGGSYSSAPAEYFGGTTRPVIPNAIDFDIDGAGNIYVLLNDGQMHKYREGTREIFQFAAFPPGEEIAAARSMYLDDSVTSQSMYIINQHRRTIFETTLIGTFANSYRIFNESLFDLIEAVVVARGQGGREIIYAVSGNTIFAVSKE